ncbi:MAG: phosphotransferase [Planctomycetota bacterium]|nr:MAG: phosphotransferase [Planctomycetota bacterium]
MHEITTETAADYLRQTGKASAADRIVVRELAGGVSNAVFYVRVQTADDAPENSFVLKQARPQLRVAQPWFCNVERNWRELAVLRICQSILESQPPHVETADDLRATTPAVLWEDRENFAFAMTAAPMNHGVWKQWLLTGGGANFAAHARNGHIATACGRLLARLHSGSWRDKAIRAELGDTAIFDALRIDPYYRTIAAVHADLRLHVERLIDSLAEHPLALVHADFSPKNLLVYPSGDRTELMMVDFETGHFGDPAFDLGFFLTHLVLKACYFAPLSTPLIGLANDFWAAYFVTLGLHTADDQRDLARRAMQHLGACIVARLDGKSPVDYLDEPQRRDAARTFGRNLLLDPVDAWPAATTRLRLSVAWL